MADILADSRFDDDWTPDGDHVDGGSDPTEGDRQGIDEHFGVPTAAGSTSQNYNRQVEGGKLARQRAAMRELGHMIRNNWISNVIVLVDTGGVGQERWKYEPAREKSDTGSDVNLVSSGFLERAGVSKDLQKELDDLELLEISGVVPGVTLWPTHKVQLKWFREKSSRIRQDWFYVAENDDFELILGSSKVGENFRAFSHTVASRRRTKGQCFSSATTIVETDFPPAEVQRAREAREEQRKKAEEETERQLQQTSTSTTQAGVQQTETKSNSSQEKGT
jgi:hypothetical protein